MSLVGPHGASAPVWGIPMTSRSRRAIPLVLAAAVAALLLPAAASAQPAEPGTVSMVSDPGDYIGQGQA